MPAPRLNLGDVALLVVDVQERLVPVMHQAEALVTQVGRLIDGVNLLGVPVLVTEQYRKGLGVTVQPVATRLTDAVCNEEKLRFSACIEPVMDHLRRTGARTVLVCGIEAHVCVLQSCLDLADAGFVVFVATDAIASRRPEDRSTAVARLTQAGVVPTTVESALLELVQEAGGERFKAILPVIR